MIVTLSDHLYKAIKRYKEGIPIRNALLWDIQKYYEHEFETGLRALFLIKQRMGIELPEDEAGFIALHIVNAQLDDTNIEKIYKVTEVISEITTIVKFHFSREFDTSTAYYYRFVTHLKFFALRLFNHKQYCEEDETELSIHDGVNLIGYTMWSPIDIISSSTGEMKKRYGLIYIDKNDDGTGTLNRYKKDSFYWYKKVIEQNGLK